MYIVKEFKKGVFMKDSEHKEYGEARLRCLELVGDQELYTEMNGDMSEGFFGNTDPKDNWICMIDKI